MDIQKFLSEVQTLDQTHHSKAGDLIYDTIHKLLKADDFVGVDMILEAIEPSGFTATNLLTFLSTTSRAKERLERREEFYDRCLGYLDSLQSGRDWDRLFKGLR